jgi:hypothetical protein
VIASTARARFRVSVIDDLLTAAFEVRIHGRGGQ